MSPARKSRTAPAGIDLRAPRDGSEQVLAELLAVPAPALELGELFAAAGHRLHLVGGSVRDLILGRQRGTPDLDFATDARPEQVQALARRYAEDLWDVGIAFGTVGFARSGVRFEVTTWRAESYTPGSRNPAVEYGTSLEGDLRRRDFTVNTLAVSVPQLVFTDLFGGLADLSAGVLRTPGRAQDSFTDDPLRMLRAARFASTLGLCPAPEVLAAIRELAPRLEIVAAERVRDELTKLLLGADPVAGLTLLVDTGLAAVVLPELPAMALSIDEHAQHKDVYAHSLTVLEQAIALESRLPGGGPDLVLRLAALLHDIGKPATKALLGGGKVSFHKHELVGARLARARLKALHVAKDDAAAVCQLIALHLRFHGYGEGAWTDSAVRRYVVDAGEQLDRLHLLTRSDCTTRNRRKADRLAAAYDALEERIARLAAEEDTKALSRPELDGDAVMAILGLPPGRDVGRAVQFLSELRLDRGLVGVPEAERALRAWADRHGVGIGVGIGLGTIQPPPPG